MREASPRGSRGRWASRSLAASTSGGASKSGRCSEKRSARRGARHPELSLGIRLRRRVTPQYAGEIASEWRQCPRHAAARSTLVEALVRAGRREEAMSYVPWFEDAAERSERPLVIAFAQRMRAFVDDSTDGLAVTVDLFARVDNRYEQARSELLLGEVAAPQAPAGRGANGTSRGRASFDAVGATAGRIAPEQSWRRRRKPSAVISARRAS